MSSPLTQPSSSSSHAPQVAAVSVSPAWAGPFPGPVPTPKLDSIPMRVFVSGASRGIGLELVRQYAAANTKSVVIAGVRDPASSAKIAALAKEFSNVHVVQLDTDSDESIAEAAKATQAITSSLDILFNNVGVLGGFSLPSKTTRATLLATLNTNVGGALVLTQALLPLLHASSTSVGVARPPPPRVVAVSTTYGSTGLAAEVAAKAGAEFYPTALCVSKAALNNLSAAFAAEQKNKGVIFLSICPGWVSTDVGGPYAPITPKDSVQGIRALVESRTLEDSGKFQSVLGEGADIPF